MGVSRSASRVVLEEREVKLAVADGWQMPPLDVGDGVHAVDRGDHRTRAVYWDSADLALARAGVGTRHRDGVWTFKGRSRREGDAVVREELEVVAGIDNIPPAIRSRVAAFVAVDMVHPVAELDTLRRTIDVTAGEDHAEVVHDRVTVVAGATAVARFAEVEVEFGAGAQRLADRLVRCLVDGGAVVHTTSKYVRALRALGHDPPDMML